MFWFPFPFGLGQSKWIAVDDNEFPITDLDLPPGSKKGTNLLGEGDAYIYDDGRLYLCTKAGYIYEPQYGYNRPAIVVKGRMKTPTELYK